MFEDILKKVKPTKEEELEMKNIVEEFLMLLDKCLVNCKPFVGGSYAKNTWLTRQHDIDIFIVFKDDLNISDKLERYLKKMFSKCERIHGSRDYFILNFKGINFELVPVLEIENYKHAKNITDVSQLHVIWVKENIKNLGDNVRLAKQFCKANRCYGAETYIKGFHGYLLEILTIYYGSFINLVKNAAKWKDGSIIDFHNNSEFKSHQKFPLIVIDPVKPDRNVASSLSNENFELFVKICGKFLKTKSQNYFKEKKINTKSYNLMFKATPLDGNKDVVGTKMLKAFERIGYELNSKGFIVNKSTWFWEDDGYFCFKVNNKLSKYEKLLGPPLVKKQHVNAFLNKYKNCKTGKQKDRIYIVKPRDFTRVKDFANKLTKDELIKSKVKKIFLI